MKKTRITFNAPVTLGFVLLCFFATLFGVLSSGKITEGFFMTYVRFFTHVLGHEGWEHFIGNASYLLLLGPMLEEKYGSKTLLEVIGITALATGLINYVFFWDIALCGASGVVFAFIVLSSFTEFKQGEIPLTFILIMFFFVGEQVYEAFAVNDNISNMAHIVGGIVGAVVGYTLNRKKF